MEAVSETIDAGRCCGDKIRSPLKAVARVRIPSGLQWLTRPFPPGDGLVRLLWHEVVAWRARGALVYVFKLD